MRFELERDGNVGKSYVSVCIYVHLWVSPFLKILGASEIGGQVGSREFKLNAGQSAAIKGFANLIGNPDRPVPSGRFVAPPPTLRPKSPDEIAREREARRRESTQSQEEVNRRRLETQLNNKLDQKLQLGKALEKPDKKGVSSITRKLPIWPLTPIKSSS